ncbi:MAG: NFYB/HAP3 family transcription factor subunit [Euryarchaeota archaeon]|nr:NFYB/HAP3 family transcription factor subunit [Euryarchaeota archaeon]MCD6158379.1 NFYB/HAP3 family transcription factor subunit [Euryarchaeota archaeon]RLF65174.1 MAG: histone [Thermoplasmata archaeon]HHC19485.1 histone [Euryarchaeota archaeon]
MTELAKAPVARLIQKAGAKRISAAAVEKMVELAEEYITKVARRAVELAKHAGRVTVKEEDIKLAAEELR